MKTRSLLAPITGVGLLALAVSIAAACDDNGGGDDATPTTEPTATSQATPPEGAGNLQLSSSAFAHNETIPTKYTCDGENVSPPLSISGVPEGVETLALLVDDPDAPSGSFVHWVVFNIDPTTGDVAEGLVPGDGTEGLNGAGQQGYTGPCPPSGTHRYVFTLYALDVGLNLDADSAGKAQLLEAMQGHALAQAELIGTYARP